MRELIVNVTSVAGLRERRGGFEPDPVAAAQFALLGGAEGIAVSLREDRRDAQDRDVRVLRQTVHRAFALSIPAVPEMLKLALDVRPERAILTPEGPSDVGQGLDVQTRFAPIGELVRALEDANVTPVLSIRADIEQVKAAHRVGASGVELHATRFAEGGPDRDAELERITDAARLARKLGLRVGVGLGLDDRSVRELARLAELDEFHVGHAIVSRALGVGMARAVEEMRALLELR